MLKEWLSPMHPRRFAATHLGRAPLARPGSAGGAVPLFDWDTLSRLLSSEPTPEVWVAMNGRMVDVPTPRTLTAARRLMARGYGIVVRHSEQRDPGIATLARAFALDLPGEVHVQLYATPAGTQTFGWHFDLEDVFVAQTAGLKDYYFRANTVIPPQPARAQPDFSLIRHEKSPLLSARLIPGDWLYIPSRWWHLVRSLQDSLSISIGVMPARPQVEETRRSPR
jgi:hypothetical protein